ncbi:MAG: tRNA uracil 4-sulfurtransferase ThiI [bacterium]
MGSTFLLRYGEIALKGQNQRYFLDTLVRNVDLAVRDLGRAEVRPSFGRVLVRTDAPADAVAERLRKVFGIVSLSRVREVDLELGAITIAAVEMAEEAIEGRPNIASFKVDTRRADKRFPLTSMEASSRVGGAIHARFPHLRAQMRKPDLLVRIEIRDRAYLSTESIAGPGGLPSGTGGPALALISGGIDSPVAAWLTARRGAVITPVHFHSFPFTSERSKEKVVDLCGVLAGYTGPLELWVIYFTDIQRMIQMRVPEALRVLVMRRMMMRICERLAQRTGALAIITGESLGQVASQTLESVSVINAATTLPVLRPLIGADKTEIVARAEAIGTYEISIRPYDDCCSLFVPAHPRTLPTLDEVERGEQGLDTGTLVEESLARSERIRISGREAVPSAVTFRA